MGERRKPNESGFTLIEILAVLVIIGVVTGIAIFSMKTLGGRSDLGEAAERLAGRIQLASENARLENMQYGLRIESHKYEFMRFNGHGWDAVSNDPVLAAQSLPSGATLDVQTHGTIKIPAAATAGGTAAAVAAASIGTDSGQMDSGSGSTALTPQIAILSTGEITPFTLRLSTGTKTYVLNGNGNGQVHVEPPGTHGTPAAN